MALVSEFIWFKKMMYLNTKKINYIHLRLSKNYILQIKISR